MNPQIDFETLRVIGEQLRTQDNLATSDPLFIVQQKRKVYGFEKGYAEALQDEDAGVSWINGEDELDITSRQGKYFEALIKGRDVPEGWTRVRWKMRWEFVTACFTRKGCEDYIAANGHNLKSPRIYVASAYRNREWIALRQYLLTH